MTSGSSDGATVSDGPARVPRSRRIAIAALIGAASAAIAIYYGIRFPTAVTDFDQVWFAARAVLQGRDPYPLIGPGREFDYQFPLYYPLPAALLATPVALFPLVAARAIMIGLSGAALAYVVTRDGYHRLAAFLSLAYLINIKIVQWPPLLGCALFIPWFGVFAAAKPNLGLAVIAGARSWRMAIVAAGSALLVTVAAFLVQPTWVSAWRAAVADAPHVIAPVTLPGGFLLLLSLLRWRRWEGRVLAVLSLMPQTPGVSSAFLLCLLPPTLTGVALLSLLSAVVLAVVPPLDSFATFRDSAVAGGTATVLLMFLPALVLVLRMPNRNEDRDRSSVIPERQSSVGDSAVPHAADGTPAG